MALALWSSGSALAEEPPAVPTGDDYIEWLKERSMYLQIDAMEAEFARQGGQWRHPYGLQRPEDFLSTASVWFSAYPSSLMGRSDANVLAILGDPELLKTLADLGIEAIHTGPVKRAGSITKGEYRPTIDGYFDRIELLIDPPFGDAEQYRAMVANAAAQEIIIIGDMVPGHTGKGPDFRLAERHYDDFPALYSMTEIRREDWPLLPAVPAGEDSVNLSKDLVQTLEDKGYIAGPLDAVVFARPGIKETNWSATAVVVGVDGKERRWVYLHIFKRGQPSLNWLDPGFGAYQLLAADILHSLKILGTRALRLDANMFLGVGPRPGEEAGWLSGHPLSVHATKTLAMLIRKFGGYSFQELNTDLENIKISLASGPELSYDFTTRPVYLHAVATGDAGPLRLMLRQMLAYDVRPLRMVHALQNHDELMLETTHLRVFGDRLFEYEGASELGKMLFEHIYAKPIAVTTEVPYNERFAMSPGVCSTFAGFAAAALDIDDLTALTSAQIEQIRALHLAAAAYNAMQPGAFALSGWDMVGALPVPHEAVKDLLADNDCRWLNRGAYDLLGLAGAADESAGGLPRAVALYGPLPEQLDDPASFAGRLQTMLKIRQTLGVAQGRLVAVPPVESAGVVMLINELPQSEQEPALFQVTAINFGREAVTEKIQDEHLKGKPMQAIFSTLQGEIDETLGGEPVTVELAPLEAKILTFGDTAPPL